MKRSFLKLINGLIALIGPFLFVLLIAVINGTIGYLLAINITLFASLAIVKFLGASLSLSYQVIFTVIIISGILRGIVRYFEQYSNHYIAFKILAIIRNKLFKALRKLPPSYLENKDKGDIVSLLQSDIETLEVFYAHTLSPFLIAILVGITMISFLSIYSIYLGLVALFAYLIIGLIIPVIFYKTNHKEGYLYRLKVAEFNEFYLDSIYGNYEIISHNQNEIYKEKVKEKSIELTKINQKLDNKNNLFTNITNLFVVILNLLILFIGYILYKNNIIESYITIIPYVVLTSSFGPFIALASLPNNLAMSFASGNRVLDILAAKNELNIGLLDFEFKELELKNVSFTYENEKILDDVSLKLNNKEIIGLYGKSGSGKSTILKLIMHFYEVNKGEILINQQNITNYSLESLYKNITLFSQSTYLFSDTIYNNLRIAKKDATEEEIIEACKSAGIYAYIMSLKDQFNTKISDLKDNISEGEKQRLGLARVFLRKPKVLLLDEATSNVDAINEGIILNALKKYQEDMTIVIISHLKSSLSICDKIYELKGGKLCLV